MKYDLGSAIIIEVEFRKQTAFSGESLFDPTTKLISVTDPAGTEVVAPTALTLTATGQYSYIVQTSEGWVAGIYVIKITSSDGANNDVTVNPTAFELK